MTIRDLRWLAGVSAVMLLTVPFVLMPLRVATWLGGKLGLLLFVVLGKWRRVGYQTVSELLPYLRMQEGWDPRFNSPDTIIRDLFVNLGILVAELSRLYHGLNRSLIEQVEVRGLEHYELARSRGKGLMFITAHAGNWELMALACGAKLSPVAVVARAMKKGYIDRILEKMRSRNGNSVIYRDRAVRDILVVLKANGIVGILVDQAIPHPHGILVDFFGRPAWTTIMPAKIALKSDAALLPCFIHREGGRNVVTIYPEVQLEPEGSERERILDATLRLNRCIEQHIIRYPSQWNWLYRRWKGTE